MRTDTAGAAAPGLPVGSTQIGSEVAYRYSHTVGFYAEFGKGFHFPIDLALDRDGIMYVVNRAGFDAASRMYCKRVTVCTVDEDYLGSISYGGAEDGQIMWPAAIAIDEDGLLYVSDEALHRISVFNTKGDFLGKWGSYGEGEGRLNRPAGIAFDGDGNLLVVDGLNNRVQKFTKEGRFLSGWGRPGREEGEFNVPWGIALDREGNVYVADWRNDRVQKFDSEGSYLATLGTPGQGDGELRRPAGIAVDGDGDIYVADWGNERVQVFDPDGGFRAKIRGEAGLSKWGEEYFISNQDELEERRLADMEPPLDRLSSGSLHDRSAATEKLFWGPTSVRLDGGGRVYVVDSLRHRVQIYQKDRS